LLSLLASVGLDMMRANMSGELVMHTAQATIEMLHMTEEDFKSEREDDPMVCDIDGVMGFFLLGREVKEDEYNLPGVTFELVADHRDCTKDFCFGQLEANLN